ncbi:class I SAM-dependent RNA methyltransferase [Saccharopolyspora gloriosae]|uniref:class I SAM-dependent RNA methyltransferase n=1 Tax=Saccharopolyspora gloriosae TaxID=455344 RepID=UPI001FB654AB|nr:TRAM domain-containing protein [Saccharopolyspora gloriosae]
MTGKLDWTGKRLKLDVGPVAHGGHCVARHEGRVVFVRHALPGEVVLAEVTDDPGKGFCRADAVEVFTAAEGRVAPPCPLADMALGHDRCGGCDWQHADGTTQRELKAAVIREQLQRLAGLDREVEVRELPGGLLRWRTRVRLAVDRVGRPGFHPHRSHRVLPVDDCPITVQGALDGLTDREWPQGAELEVAADANSEVHVTQRERAPQRRRGKRPAVVNTQVRGSAVARERAAGRSWEFSADGFWQVHPAAADTFAEVVGRLAAVPSGGVAWDLYGGVGLFAAVLAEQAGPAGEVFMVESSRRATEDAVANLRDLPQVSFRAGTVEDVLADDTLPTPDVVVLDPPRKGAGRQIVEAVCGVGPARVVHVACDPAALARDVSLFAEQGYRLADLEAFDAFPMTHHMECIALLERES